MAKRVRLAALAGLLALNISGCAGSSKSYSSYKEQTSTIESQESNLDEEQKEKFNNYMEKLEQDFAQGEVNLTEVDNEYIKDIKIDGTEVHITLKDKSFINGTLKTLNIKGCIFEDFSLYDQKYSEACDNADTLYENYEELGYESALDALDAEFEENHDKLMLDIHDTKVTNEIKIGKTKDVILCPEMTVDGDYYGPDNILYAENILDWNECQNVWIDRMSVYNGEFFKSKLSNMPNLKTLILTDIDCLATNEFGNYNIEISSDTLEGLIIEYTNVNLKHRIENLHLNNCTNLKKLMIPTNSDIDENRITVPKGIEVFSFGMPTLTTYEKGDIDETTFDEKMNEIYYIIDTSDIGFSESFNQNSFVNGLSFLKNTDIQILNIGGMQYSENFLKAVKSMSNLKEIIGHEIDNAGVCSDELLLYCEENGIETCFTERSLEIKHELENVISEIIKPGMTDDEKIKAISQFVVDKMKYNDNLANDGGENTAISRKIAHGEKLYYSLIFGDGICDGYARLASALFTEAGIENYQINTYGHTYDLVETEDGMYYVDLTFLDTIMNELGITNIDEQIDGVNEVYMVPIKEADYDTWAPNNLPVEADEVIHSPEEDYEQTAIEHRSFEEKYNKEESSSKSENLASKDKENMIVYGRNDYEPIIRPHLSKYCIKFKDNDKRILAVIGILRALGCAYKAEEKITNEKGEKMPLNEAIKRVTATRTLQELRYTAYSTEYLLNELSQEKETNKEGVDRDG